MSTSLFSDYSFSAGERRRVQEFFATSATTAKPVVSIHRHAHYAYAHLFLYVIALKKDTVLTLTPPLSLSLCLVF